MRGFAADRCVVSTSLLVYGVTDQPVKLLFTTNLRLPSGLEAAVAVVESIYRSLNRIETWHLRRGGASKYQGLGQLLNLVAAWAIEGLLCSKGVYELTHQRKR